MDFPEELRYTKNHEWIRLEDDIGVVGITDYAQGELGDIVFVELPTKGKQLKQGESFGTIEAVKAVSDLYAPVSGDVMEAHTELDRMPELVNKEPYGGGWLVKVRVSNKAELTNLLDARAYRDLVGK